MRLAAGMVAPEPYPIQLEETALVQFTISPDRLSEVELLDSGSATPGRYVGEMLRRLRRLYPTASHYLAITPQRGIPGLAIERILRQALGLDPAAPGAFLFVDGLGRPVGYFIRAEDVDWCPAVHYGLLTCEDGALDLRFLAACFGEAAYVGANFINITGVTDLDNGFVAPVGKALMDVSRRAVELMESVPAGEARRELITKGQRVAVVGYHAGDVLFTLQAMSLERTSFGAIVVPRDYADIVAYLRPDLEPLVVQLPVPNRGAYRVFDEFGALRDYIDQLTAQGHHAHRFYHLLRPLLRDYNRTRHHLREIAAFAIGGEGHGLRPLPPLSADCQRDYGLMRPLRGRVVVQFDAGWATKEFPPDSRGELLALLRHRGYDPVILGKPEAAAPSVPAVPYTDLAGFRALLGSAEALIGCDSFPSHFADAWGVPTITLFGSTKPQNSRGTEGPRYRYLHRGLSCVPCLSLDVCKLDNGRSCRAHASAWDVLAALEAMAPPGCARRPLPAEERDRLIQEVVPTVFFPGGPPLPEADRARYVDQLLGGVALERLGACPFCGGADLEALGERFTLPLARCRGCGLRFVQERIAEQDLGVLYSERYWTDFMRLHGYSTHVERYLFDYVAALERVKDVARILPAGGATLDIGCCLGAFPRRLTESGYEAAGVEMDAALRRKAALYSGVPVYASPEEAAAGRRYDLVTMFDVFEHLYQPVEYLRRLRSIMSPGGALLLETFRTDSPAFEKDGLDHEDVKPLEHPFMYTTSHIEELLRRAGLRVERLSYPQGADHARVRVAARLVEEGAHG